MLNRIQFWKKFIWNFFHYKRQKQICNLFDKACVCVIKRTTRDEIKNASVRYRIRSYTRTEAQKLLQQQLPPTRVYLKQTKTLLTKPALFFTRAKINTRVITPKQKPFNWKLTFAYLCFAWFLVTKRLKKAISSFHNSYRFFREVFTNQN